jgi:phosphatidylserine/phosphatidylglycerophosphate/cardiolipin synthase-like enzyme
MQNKRLSFWVMLIIISLVVASCASESTTSGTTGSGNEAVSPTTAPQTGDGIEEVALGLGRGYIGDWWAVFFNEPNGESDKTTYVNGIDVVLADAIGNVQSTLDIAAFEMNNEVIVAAILAAHERGITVRIVTDDEHGIEDKDGILQSIADAGVPVVDDSRSALMHNKFIIMDSEAVWTGSWNYTVNGTYRNNNNALVMQNAQAVDAYQAEFDEMFNDKKFGSRSPDQGVVTFTQSGTDVTIIFASEGDEIPVLAEVVRSATSNIRIMTFVFSSDELGAAVLDMVDKGVTVQGVFENRNSKATWSELPALHCAGADMRQDGNKYTLHHKVFIIDDDTVVTGSFNYSNNAVKSNDENVVIIKNKDIAGFYIDEWQQLWDNAQELEPDEVTCS